MSIMLFVSNIDFIIYLITKYLLLVVCSVTYLINVVIVFNMSIMFQVCYIYEMVKIHRMLKKYTKDKMLKM